MRSFGLGGALTWQIALYTVLFGPGLGCRYGYDELASDMPAADPDSGAVVNNPPADAGVDASDPVPFLLEFGTGSAGPLTVTEGELQINDYAAVVGDVVRGGRTLSLDRPLTAPAGMLALLWQSGTREVMASGSQTNIVLDTSPIGQWELVRFAADVSGTAIQLEAGVRNQYSDGTTQLVTVPEYTTVTISAGAAVVARPWDGEVGGIVAFLTEGELALAGSIRATGAGYRGGLGEPKGNSDFYGCIDLDTPPPGGEAKGEGVVLGFYGQDVTGRGNLASGGGGGSCHNSGGGGGGHQGAGGYGGIVDYEDPLQPPALGGAATVASSMARLSMGGGGGAGEAHHGDISDGGNGGGMVLIGARVISGEGVIEADGVEAPSTFGDGAGGGGAGGAIYIHSEEVMGCARLSASGGPGGSSEDGASGGGGGGGRIIAPTLPCETSLAGGEDGVGTTSAAAGQGRDGTIITIPAGGF